MTYKYLPVSLSLEGKRCLVVGGGNVALRKIETLLEYNAALTVVAIEPVDKLNYYAEKGKLMLEKREYQSPEAARYDIVIAASDSLESNQVVARDCREAHVPINAVDSPDLCDFIFPAILRRDCLTVAVSTDGKAPFLSGHLRLILDSVFPERWAKIARYAAQFRNMVFSRWKDNRTMKLKAYGRFLDADWKQMTNDLDDSQIEIALEKMLEE
ncbi:MAG: bifunctional precorrin-2 dehydrogenase/sirohydrochlorin ferrochelatase [bacterium]|jgi:siroheme synthase-like protein